ncbi:hypothetical protein GE061_009601 [Apolygus lucorum]|uniref:Uncharacterized protein n=1 Tax=Apolygus lucorum TaxID=248454 RepID=A0A8S9Y0Z2_APOLU|nr:hypothetical protein GE061_011510 [Apolygus lucorum]KAF6214857.1 hypothetical protein GE061_009601 [Apolygus lucorum]
MVDLRLNDIQPEYEEASTNVDMGKIISAGCMNVEIPDLPDTRRQTAQLNQVEPAFALESPGEALEDPLETAARTGVVNAPPSTSEVDPEMEENHLIHEEERLVRRIGPERTASLTHYDPVRPEETRAEVRKRTDPPDKAFRNENPADSDPLLNKDDVNKNLPIKKNQHEEDNKATGYMLLKRTDPIEYRQLHTGKD